MSMSSRPSEVIKRAERDSQKGIRKKSEHKVDRVTKLDSKKTG